MATYTPAPVDFSSVPGFQGNPFVSGFRMINTSTTQFTVGPGCCRALCNDGIISFPSFQAGSPSLITVDITVTGPNGVFPNSIASLGLTVFTQFPVYVCANSSGTYPTALNSNTGGTTNTIGPIVIVATGNNFLPVGYDIYRRIGWLYINDDTSLIIPFTQAGNNNEKQYVYSDPYVALSGGAATTATVVDLTANDGPIPGNQRGTVLLNLQVIPNAADGYLYVEPGLATAAGAMPTQLFGSVAAHKNSMTVSMDYTPNASTGNAEIKYLVDNAASAGTINVIGFTDSLGNSLV